MASDPRLNILRTRPVKNWSYPRILLGIPIERAISYADKVFYSFMDIAACDPSIAKIPYMRVDVARNLLATKVLSERYTHALMLDVDHVHPSDIIQRFAARVIVNPELKVISGWNYRRGAPFDPTSGFIDERGDHVIIDEWPQGIIEVQEVGSASLLVAREVFEELEPPWFFNPYDRVWENNYPGEDTGFSKKCREAGIKMYSDTTISSPHCIDTLVNESTFRAYLKTHVVDEPEVTRV